MARNQTSVMVENRDDRDQNDRRKVAGEPQIRDEELFRMAAFRIRETANRIATLANSAQDAQLRSELIAACDRLLEEERRLLTLSGRH